MTANNKPQSDDALIGRPEKSAGVAILYVTFPSREAAMELGREMIEQGLAGCINVLPAMTSIYKWKTQLETADEAVMIVKVAWEGVERAVRFVKSRHPYEMPAIMALPVIGGSVEYLEWIRAGTSPQSDEGQ